LQLIDAEKRLAVQVNSNSSPCEKIECVDGLLVSSPSTVVVDLSRAELFGGGAWNIFGTPELTQ
jgi:hypothetical protein